jgi:hypothetical protein
MKSASPGGRDPTTYDVRPLDFVRRIARIDEQVSFIG